MKVRRSFLVRVVQIWEGDELPPSEYGEPDDDWMEYDQDQFVCDNWNLISDEIELLDDDQLEYEVIEK